MGSDAIRRILVPVDGSEGALRAVRHVVAERDTFRAGIHVVLLNVQPAVLSGAVKHFVGPDRLEAWYRAEGEAALAPARDLLAAAGVPHEHHIMVGDAAEVIVSQALERDCQSIVMGTRGLGAMSAMVLGSVAAKVVGAAHLPVTLVR